MAENAWPFYGQVTTETQFSQWARAVAAESGIQTGLGIAPNGGMGVGVAAGFGAVRGLAYENTATKTLIHGAAPATAGHTRLDAYILKLNQGTNTITAEIKAGSANSSGGVLPALQQDETIYEFLLGYAAIPNGVAAVTAAMVTELRPMLGVKVLVNTAARRPAATASSGALFYNLTTGQLQYSNGVVWNDLITMDTLSGILGIAKGGTGVTTYKALRDALDIRVQPGDPGHKAGRVWIPGTALA